MEIVSGCKCGKELTEKDFASCYGKAEELGLPKGTFGNIKLRFVKLACPDCGFEYVGEVKPGKQGGSTVLGRIVDIGLNLEKPDDDDTQHVETDDPDEDTSNVERVTISDGFDSDDPFERMTFSDLKGMARDMKIPGFSSMRKPELIEAIQKENKEQ